MQNKLNLQTNTFLLYIFCKTNKLIPPRTLLICLTNNQLTLNLTMETLKIFRFVGDALMIISRLFLMQKIKSSASVSGLSLKTNFLYLIVYLLRYVDLFWVKYTKPVGYRTVVNWLNVYNSCFKVFLISFQLLMCYLIAIKYRKSYYGRFDTFPISVLLLISCVISALISSKIFFLVDFSYTLSLVLESVAILPQLVMTQESEDCESMTSKYIFLLGLYRFNYMIYFVLLKVNGKNIDMLMIFTSLIQTALYIDFFKTYYSYMISKNGAFKSFLK